MTTTSKEQFRALAGELAKESIVTKALARFLEQVFEEVYEQKIEPMERQTIIDLIHEHYDPEPKDWPRHRGWDDGAGEIADKIIAAFQRAPGETAQTVETCPECGILADTMLHRFCTHRYCPTRAALSR